MSANLLRNLLLIGPDVRHVRDLSEWEGRRSLLYELGVKPWVKPGLTKG